MNTVTALKKQKSLDNQTHIILYENIQLLKHLFPTTKNFDAVCKPDMFVKNNKAAFQHLIYYLLKILNPNVRQNVPSWPILCIKMEVQFRKEVMTYLNQLKDKYPECNLQNVVTSQLINPGGLKFTNFMLNVSELVILQVLEKKAGRRILRPPKCNTNFPEQTKIMTAHISRLTEDIAASNSNKLKEHYNKYEMYHNEAEQITDEIVQTKLNILSLKETLAQLRAESLGAPDFEEIDAISRDLDEQYNICNKFSHCKSVLLYYNSDDCFLEYSVKLEEGQSHSKPLDLLKYFEMFQKMCTLKIFDVRHVSQVMVDEKLEIIARLLRQCDELSEKGAGIQKRQEELMNDLKFSAQKTETGELTDTLQNGEITPFSGNTPSIIITSS